MTNGPIASTSVNRTVCTMMGIYFDTVATATERSEVEQWCATHNDTDIEYVSIDKPAVFVHGSKGCFEAVTGRVGRNGKLAGELTAALAVMRSAALASDNDR